MCHKPEGGAGELFAEQMEHHIPAVGGGAVLENVDALPCSERHAALLHGNRQLGEGEGGPYVSGHIVGTFDGVAIQAVVLGDQAIEEGIEVVDDVGVGILLDGQGCRSVLHKYGEQAGADAVPGEPPGDRRGDFVEALAARRDL